MLAFVVFCCCCFVLFLLRLGICVYARVGWLCASALVKFVLLLLLL